MKSHQHNLCDVEKLRIINIYQSENVQPQKNKSAITPAPYTENHQNSHASLDFKAKEIDKRVLTIL